MRILITGGAGFIGQHLAALLVQQRHEVTVLDDFSTGRRNQLTEGSEIIGESVLNRKELKLLCRDKEVVVHLAAKTSVAESVYSPDSYYETNVVGTQNVLEAARANGFRTILASSAAVYGSNSKVPVSEEDWVHPKSPYAASKLAAEALAAAFTASYNLEVCTLRIFNVFGPNQPYSILHSPVIPSWISQAAEGQPIRLFGNGSQRRDFLYIDSLTAVIAHTCSAKHVPTTPINVGSGLGTSLNTLVTHLRKTFPDLEIVQETERTGDVMNSVADITKLKDFIGVYPRRNFASDLAATAESYLSNSLKRT